MKKLSVLAAALAASWLALAGEASAQKVLRVANWLPPSHPLVKDIMQPWMRQVEEATQGRVKLQLLDAPLGPPPAHFDFAANGVADVTYGVHNYTPGRFVATQLAELPFLSEEAEALSVAHWRVFQKHTAKADEHRGTHVLAVFTHGPGHLFVRNRDVTSLDALKGLKIRIGGGVAKDVAEALGLVTLQAPSTQAYELLSTGVADGIQFPAESISFFKLENTVTDGLVFPGGYYFASFFIVMNQNTWDSLSAEDKAAIDKVSGEPLARMAGKAWDAADKRGWEAMKAAGVKLTTAEGKLLEDLKSKLQPVIDRNLQAIAAKGIDAQAAYRDLLSEIAAAKAGK